MDRNAWYIVELKGRFRRAGHMEHLSNHSGRWVKIYTPHPDGDGFDEEFFHPSAVFSFREVNETEARAVAAKLWAEWEGA